MIRKMRRRDKIVAKRPRCRHLLRFRRLFRQHPSTTQISPEILKFHPRLHLPPSKITGKSAKLRSRTDFGLGGPANIAKRVASVEILTAFLAVRVLARCLAREFLLEHFRILGVGPSVGLQRVGSPHFEKPDLGEGELFRKLAEVEGVLVFEGDYLVFDRVKI